MSRTLSHAAGAKTDTTPLAGVGTVLVGRRATPVLTTVVTDRPWDFVTPDGPWDDLLAASPADSVFLSAAWLRAACDTYETGRPLRLAVVRDPLGPVAAVLAVRHGRGWRLAGTGPSDYLDVPLHRRLGDDGRRTAVRRLFAALGPKAVVMRNLATDAGTPALLRAGLGAAGSQPRWHGVLLRHTVAPTLDMSQAAAALAKSTPKRREKQLAKLGTLDSTTASDPQRIARRLPVLFAMHRQRWSGTGSPSLFEQAAHRRFFEEMVRRVGPSGRLRWTELTLDGRPLAVHLGFVHAGRYSWYKPAHEPDFAHLSPGQVLLKRLIQQARDEPVDEFDFTIGDEEFKSRYATRRRRVVDVLWTPSPVQASWHRTRLRLRRLARRLVRR